MYMMLGDGVVRQKDGICRLRSNLCTQTTSGSLRSRMCAPECTHPLQQSVWAGVLGWVLQQGEGARNGGQQLVVHGADRPTVD